MLQHRVLQILLTLANFCSILWVLCFRARQLPYEQGPLLMAHICKQVQAMFPGPCAPMSIYIPRPDLHDCGATHIHDFCKCFLLGHRAGTPQDWMHLVCQPWHASCLAWATIPAGPWQTVCGLSALRLQVCCNGLQFQFSGLCRQLAVRISIQHAQALDRLCLGRCCLRSCSWQLPWCLPVLTAPLPALPCKPKLHPCGFALDSWASRWHKGLRLARPSH